MQNPSSKKQLPAFLVLAIIAVAAALVLGLTNAVTKGPIEEHRMAALNAAYGAVMPAAKYDKMDVNADGVSGLYQAKDESGNVIGYCVTAAAKGYGGNVAVTLGVDEKGVVSGCVIGDNDFAETDGFGKRAQEPAFQEQFVGLNAVDGGTFMPLSGATITSKAVLNATNAALGCVANAALGQEVQGTVAFGEKQAPTMDASAIQPGASLRGEAEGYGGQNVIVTVKLGDDATIAKIKVDASTQTPGLGQRCAEAEFTDRFIGKSLPVEGVDVLSGCTITSNAVVDAINGSQPCEDEGGEEAITAMAEKDGVAVGVNESGAAVITAAKDGAVTLTLTVKDGKVTAAEIGDVKAPAGPAANEKGEYVVSEQGFQSKVGVTLTLDADGAIATLKINSSNETEYIGTMVGESKSFVEQFIGKKGPFTLGENCDAVSGATISSTAAVKAINQVFSAPAAEKKAAVEPNEKGEYVVSEQGFQSKVGVTATLNEDGTIATLKVNSSNETEYIGTMVGESKSFAEQFIGKKGPFTLGENCDAVSGATISSTAAVKAINQIVGAPAEKKAAVEPNEKGEYVVSEQGFQSKVGVTATLNEDGTIATLKVNSSNETEYIGTMVGESKSFVEQFIGKKGPFTLGENCDAVSGATISSTAAVNAINAMFN